MKTVTIIAKDKNKVELGRRDEDQPETLEEFREQFEDAQIVKLAWSAHVIDVQRELRGEARPGIANEGKKAKDNVAKMIVQARKLKSEGDSTLFDQLVGLGIIES